jgi:hypothetical protein
MIQENHRGIYEHLWSEHKYTALSISLKTFQTTAGKMGKVPQCLSLLRRLAGHALSERPDWLNGILNAYMHIKPLISRQRREEIIETLLSVPDHGSQMIFSDALALNEASLFGCRLFYPAQKAIYKFWDGQDKPGLWVLFGPFQLHLTPETVFWRLKKGANSSPNDLLQHISLLKSGIALQDYLSWPADLRELLENSNMVATPGSKAMLHPRANFAYQNFDLKDPRFNSEEIAAMTLEKIWDQQPLSAENFPFVPEPHVFKDNCPDKQNWQTAFSFIEQSFEEQKIREQGKL